VTVEVNAPEVPVRLPDEIRLQLPDLEEPVHPAPPEISIDGLVQPAARTHTCGRRHVIT
jgi:hypothetical protein